ncbi:MAG: hypothetical protein LBO70_05305 [Clostridiales Family XIII bacterium]|jgi:hypothetical protein|nr:hypothetical protein [Clostridiales Family XIII bacterium]
MARVGYKRYEDATGELKEAYDALLSKSGNITNMKLVLGNSWTVYDAYIGWYRVWDKLVEVVGERAAIIFAHSISTTNGCILCSLFFIQDIKDLGENPADLVLDEKETLLVELGQTAVKNPNGVSDALISDLKKYFNDEELVVIVGFAGEMIMYNVFNSILDVDVDDRLLPIKGEFKPETWREKDK